MIRLLTTPRDRLAWAFNHAGRLGALATVMMSSLPTSALGADLRDFLADLHGGSIVLESAFPDCDPPSCEQIFTNFSIDSSSLPEIASTIGFFPLGSGSSGTGFDSELGIPIPETLGPIAGERATTVGGGRLNVAISYSYRRFERFAGRKLSDFRVRLSPPDGGSGGLPDGVRGPQGSDFAYELDELILDIDIEIEQQVMGIVATYGMTDSWDVGLVFPLATITAKARSEASINRIGSNSQLFHNFSASEPRVSSTGGRATGIGDLVLRSKLHLLERVSYQPSRGYFHPDVGIFGEIRLPTGDEKNLLGSGYTAFLAMLIVSDALGPFAAYGNLGYEVTTSKSHEVDHLRYNFGCEVILHQQLNLAGGISGRWRPSAEVIPEHVVDWNLGARWNLWRTLVATVNFQLPANPDTGLRSTFTSSFGLEYTFGAY